VKDKIAALKKRIDEECEKHPLCFECPLFEVVHCMKLEYLSKEHIEKIEKIFNEVDNEKKD